VSDAQSGQQTPLHRAIRKYGATSFAIRCVKRCRSWECACKAERQLIEQDQSMLREFQGYNATAGGEGTLGIDRSSMRGANNQNHATNGGSSHMRGDRNHMRRPEHRERMRGAAHPAKRPGAMDAIRGALNPAKRPEVRAKLLANHPLKDPARREAILQKMAAAQQGRPHPWQLGDRNPSRRPEILARKMGGHNPNSRAVEIHGVRYETLREAAQALGVRQATTITNRLRRGEPGYRYL
jgi:hypothetical protein